ncbi:MAG: response regulator transcription factor [SAR202 cluster bacterium]|jgi:DNA-binding response OmpR family regulator|nr:DNA-binding response regulator [Chloroflexota bacterium]MDP6421179.1 response regulator transcription factor [SAR202 cluster bacterium]HAL46599.1 DNA-binding response regulator [Dehalococcoidia bacterium]MDP6663279.1 response regulator transcription factor [SAR202 cluster bacterium]MDP6800446.1 response regulator transcription factor [SAR202 cluster bacterium]|tara:strand:- start:7081 stop:7773 length:693 start_codon:yes stop_codon:yes gene_type:complete
MANTVLVVEDEANLLAALSYNLGREGYEVLTAENGEAGLALARQHDPDLVILDVMLPILDGFEVCRELRKDSAVPILMLTAKGEEIDRVVGLELGADDYVTKPFSTRELMARVRNMLRRTAHVSRVAHDASEIIVSGDLVIDNASHSVKRDGEPLALRPREFSLLSLLAANKGRAFSREQILERLWSMDYIGDSRTVDVHVRWLREKIEPEPANPQRIVTIRSIGYRFDG